MKKLLFITIGLISSSLVSSQVITPNGMFFCPKGTYTRVIYSKTISVAPFFISNEITNGEFREFYNIIRKSPNDTIYWIDYELAQKEPESGRSYIVKKTYQEILPILIDLKVWEENPSIKNQFFDNKSNDYPVIGVTLEGAKYYCIWKTDEINKVNNKKEKDLEPDFRLPFEEEWEYATTVFNSLDNANNTVLKESFNNNEVSNLGYNLSEWVVNLGTIDEPKNIYRGGSYKTQSGFDERGEISKYKFTDFIGFRIVKTKLEKE
ncbi:MAG: SUMF1/EgtB/PvdO family nonheme iron enzyme [Salinivirgaceae bacterium]|jgi:formylglycine-generating enzyme required for sulfatase activity